MKRLIPFTLFLCSVSTAVIHAQERFAYAITDQTKEGANWSSLRKLDMETGTYSAAMLNGLDVSIKAYDAVSKQQLIEPLQDSRFGNLANAAFGTGVAGIAYDKKNHRIYFTPMLLDQLRYVDLRTMKVFFLNNESLTGGKEKAADQSNIITRMAFGSDGNGYALTNDANNLIQFTTGKKVRVTNLGAITDDITNSNISIHNSCTSFGGDMIADDDGNLYVFSAYNHVFRINIESKVATYLGNVKGLPAGFTANGVAVADQQTVWVSSALDNSGLYSVNIKTLNAAKVNESSWKSSDLANGNLLSTRTSKPVPVLMTAIEEVPNKLVQLYPNPVTGKQFDVRMNLTAGEYTLSMTDIIGRQTLVRSVLNIKGSQTEHVNIPTSTQNGMYLVRVLDASGKPVFSKKVIVQ